MAAEKIGQKAYEALIEEVITTPKPGLVDLYSNGAHTDMDAGTFRRSAEALRPFFVSMAETGLGKDGDPEDLFLTIRKTGLEAEKAMYAATGGVNTHKGIIFTFGLFCAAAGRLLQKEKGLTPENLLDMQQRMTVRILSRELADLRRQPAVHVQLSHGEQNLRRYGTTGIRGEAIAGYPDLFRIGLPVLQDGIRQNMDWNRVKLQTLLSLMAQTEDSNILSRGGPEELKKSAGRNEGFSAEGRGIR